MNGYVMNVQTGTLHSDACPHVTSTAVQWDGQEPPTRYCSTCLNGNDPRDAKPFGKTKTQTLDPIQQLEKLIDAGRPVPLSFIERSARGNRRAWSMTSTLVSTPGTVEREYGRQVKHAEATKSEALGVRVKGISWVFDLEDLLIALEPVLVPVRRVRPPTVVVRLATAAEVW